MSPKVHEATKRGSKGKRPLVSELGLVFFVSILNMIDCVALVM